MVVGWLIGEILDHQENPREFNDQEWRLDVSFSEFAKLWTEEALSVFDLPVLLLLAIKRELTDHVFGLEGHSNVAVCYRFK